MRVLLDTHAFLWWNLDDPSLSAAARAVIEDGGNDIFVSAATAWEIAIKAERGRLELPVAPARFVPDRMALHGFDELPIGVSHALRAGELPQIHSDPFDRLLVAQSQLEDLPVVTADPAIGRYDIDVLW